jgi:outer membrane receptor protein involved in Fe transport
MILIVARVCPGGKAGLFLDGASWHSIDNYSKVGANFVGGGEKNTMDDVMRKEKRKREATTKRKHQGVVLTVSGLSMLLAPQVFQDVCRAETQQMEEMVVTGAREGELLKEKPQAIGVIQGQEIQEVKPSHPSEILNRVPGVWIGATAGEGHITAIRQPLTTNPVYLFLEDGIPIRSTGFFNHNALYEINLPGADRIEVTKGPSSALYGSDAIGGTINVLTRPAPTGPEVEINPEMGEYGWRRLLATGGDTWGDNGFRLDYNNTHSDGWRQRSEYDRQSATLRWDNVINQSAGAKTILAFSDIDQKTGGSNGLLKTDYETRPSYNYQTFDYRKVKALRLSTELEKELDKKTLLSLVPYFRSNSMDLLPGWGIFQAGPNYYGYESTTDFYSLGMLAKYRQDFDLMRGRVIAGLDVDYSPGDYKEKRIQAFKTGDQYTSFTPVGNTTNDYDYQATFLGTSPYVQVEVSPLEKLRFTVGARYDVLSYDYKTNLAANINRPANTELTFEHVSPKAGLAYAITQDLNGFLAYSNAFRAPSSGDLFRGNSGTASTAVNLKPIEADNYELGLNGRLAQWLTFNTAVYYMEKTNDIVNYSPTTGLTERRNAGKTGHKGVEVGLGIKPTQEISLDVSYSNAKHTYKEYQVSPALDYSGNEMPQAPRTIVNTRLAYRPSLLSGSMVELEWMRLGSYWLDDANTEKYDGHDIFNLRAAYRFNKQWEAYAKLLNIADTLYAERVSKSGSSLAQYAPGQPETLFAGVTYTWGAK